jgi:Tfp pilus assembly protein PilN
VSTVSGEFIVDFLPRDVRRRGVLATSRRRSMLLLGLLGSVVVGVACHSWNRFHQAEARRGVSLALTTNATKVDDVIDRLAGEQRELHRYLSVYDRLALPVEQSDIIATITNLMPDRTSLSMLRMEVKESAAGKGTDGAANAKPVVAPGGASNVRTAAPSRWMEITIRGYAQDNADLYEFERKLANTKPFAAVTVSENKPTDIARGRIQEFAVNCRIDLDVQYVRPGGSPVASVAKGGSR